MKFPHRMNMAGGMVEYPENKARSFSITFGWSSHTSDKITNIALWFSLSMALSFADAFKLVEEGPPKKLTLPK